MTTPNEISFSVSGELQINKQKMTTKTIELATDAPKALTGGAAVTAKNPDTCLTAFVKQLGDDDVYGKSLINSSIVQKFGDVDDFLRNPGLGYNVIFGINSRKVVGQIKEQQSSAYMNFTNGPNGRGVRALLIRGETKMTQPDYDKLFMMRDLSKCAIIGTNAIVDEMWDKKRVMALMPQARARYSDSAVIKAAAVVRGAQPTDADVVRMIKSLNIATERKPSQLKELKEYDEDVALAQVLYGMVIRSATETTIKIGRDTVRKIIKDSPGFSFERTRLILTVLIENSGGNSADVDQLVQMASSIISQVKVPRDVRINSGVQERVTIQQVTPPSAVTPERMAELLAKQEIAIAQELEQKMNAFVSGRSDINLSEVEYIMLEKKGLLTQDYKDLIEASKSDPNEL